jgi:putative oxygen-independent coproporphyrinogen III oxidase
MLARTPHDVPLTVYVHLPWCLAKCPYCDFNSHVAPAQLPQDSYVDCLLGDLDHDLPQVAGRQVQAVFFGGGTPSLFAPRSIARVLDGLRQRLPLVGDAEVTLEANPGALEYGEFAGYLQAGVTRISLGVQSFDDAHLKRLGRVHNGGQAQAAVAALRSAGFANFNLDLMYGLPEQTLTQAAADVAAALALSPTHISHYQLALEPGTVFFHRAPKLPHEDSIWEMQLACQQALSESGFEQYEVSAYARAGWRCRHNLNYWRYGDYLGLGAGAHGKWTDVTGQVVRTERVKQPREYLAATASARVAQRHCVAATERPFEFMLNALRLTDGFDSDLFQARTGVALAEVAAPLQKAVHRGLLAAEGTGWRPTQLGARFLNDLQALFLP